MTLQPRPVPVPPPSPSAIPQDLLPGDGRAPLRTGQLVMSPALKDGLKKLGWQEGDPIPGDLGKEIQAAQNRALAEKASASLQDSSMAAGYVPPKAKIVDIGSLPPEEQERLRGYLADYKAEVARQDQQDQAAAEAEASIPEHIQGPMRAATIQAMQQQQAASHGVVAEVIDDGPSPHEPPAGVKIPEGKQYGGMVGGSNVAQKIEQMAATQAAAKQPPKHEPAPEPPRAGVETTEVARICPRCSYPTDQPFDVEISPADRKRFVSSMLGLKRFEKTYDLLGGHLKVKFRTLDSGEVAAIQDYLAALSLKGKIVSMPDYLLWMKELRLVLSIVQLQSGDVPLREIPPLATWWEANRAKFGSNSEERVLHMKNFVYDEVVPQEPIRRMLGQQFSLFQRLVEGLEAQSASSDFWTGIDLSA